MEPLPATFYGAIDHRNPVIATFENEIKQFLGFIRKLQRAPPGDGHQQEHRRGSSTLFHIWVKYKPRLPTWYYQEKLLKVGDSLVHINEHKLALFQCYERYLEQFCSVDIDDIIDVDQFKSTFFPSGTNDKKAALTFHALQGRCICIYQLVKTSDANLRNEESVKKCLKILAFLQLIMQVVLPQEHLCWLIFNGTLHIYTICRHLMVLGHSSQVFARRALGKINELSQLENISDSSYNEETKKAFKESTLKMAVMIFKRAVFESRRKPKGILRPKLKNNLKETEKLPWPRTNTERLLIEMFGNNSSQFLAIIEALADSNRRVFQGGPPVPDEPEIHDVIAELFFAGIDILSGGGQKAERGTAGNHQGELYNLMQKSSLLELAVEENNAVSAEAAVKFSKLAFSYENWDVFDVLIAPLYTFLKAQESRKWKKEEMDLRLLLAAEPLLSGKKHNHGIETREDCSSIAQIPDYLETVGLKGDSVDSKSPDDSRALAETLFSCVCNSLQEVQPDKDIVIDVVLFLWQKCKTGMQRIHSFAVDGSKFVHKCEMSSKWIYILCLTYEVMQQSNIIDTDAAILGEAALKLAGIAESMADAVIKSGNKSDRSHENVNLTLRNARTKPTYLKRNPVKQLIFAYETLDKAIKGLSVSRSQGTVPQCMSVVDHYITMLGVKRQHGKNTAEEQSCSSKSLVNNVMMMNLQLELIVAQHRVSVKLLNEMQVDGEHLRSSKNSNQNQERMDSLCFNTETEILDKINKNKLSKAIFLMQKAVLFNKGLNCSPNKLLEDSQKLIQQAEAEEIAIYLSCIKQSEAKGGKLTVPPPPLLLCRTENVMVFKPAPFKSDIKVAWYCLFGQSVTGPNLKVRLNDHHLAGTGEEVPANSNSLLVVKGLKKNEKYIFAVAAYSADGRLIGDMIGESTKPILAFPPLSVPATWAYLAQSAYIVGNYNVAKKACSALWNYFVLPAIPAPTTADKAGSKEGISQMRLFDDAISNSSPILLQLFLGSIFILNDINIKEKALFCDSVCDGGILLKGQICRIGECERLLVALDVSTLLSDASYALQAVVQCYGLIAPVIYHRIPSVPVVQILIKCLAVLQEIPSSTWQRKQAGVTECVLHMTACIVYYVAKVLRSWEEYEGAISVIETGKKLLDLTESTSSIVPAFQSKSSCQDDTVKALNASNKDKGYVPKKYQKKKASIAEKVNEHLSVLEYNLLKLTKPLSGEELTGQEDPLLLQAVVSCWSLNAAFREIMKFKKKSRFLEFSVQLMQRALYEEKFQKVLEWTTTVFDYLKRSNAAKYLTLPENPPQCFVDVFATKMINLDSLSVNYCLKRRSENVLGNQQHEDKGDVPGLTDSFRRYTAALVEYQKGGKPSTPNEAKKQNVTKNKMEIHKPKQKKKNHNLDLHRLTREELEKKAFTALILLLTPIVGRYIKRKRRIQVSVEEMPWRAQMNILLALTHFSLFKKKLSQLCSEEPVCVQSINSYRVLNPELFTLHHAGTVVMATDTNAEEEQMSSPGHLHPSLKLDLPPDAKLTDSVDYSNPSTIRSDMDSARTQMTNDIETPSLLTKKQAKINMSSVILLNHLGNICIHLKRAVVLAHRGGHWTLLQNASRVLWNLVLELQLITKQFEATEGLFPITRDLLNKEIWMPLYFAADMILDMIVALQNTGSVQVIDEDEKFSFPSCMGGIADEEGGSNLTFEYPFDDVTVIDIRWIRDLVLKAIEVLNNMRRWEALVHVAVQFNLLSHERFTEQVTPVLVHAQRMLAGRIFKTEGSETYFIGATEESDRKMHCRNYIGKPLYVSTISNKERNPGAEIDHRRHIGYSDDKQLETRTCVPVDVMDTFACFRNSLLKSKYSSRALKHSRKLITLFLAHSQGLNAEEKLRSPHTSYGKVGFSAGALQAHCPVPPDLSTEEFLSLHSIASKPIPPSHLSVVIASYDKTIEILHSDRQQSLKAQALHELGSLHLYTGNKRAAFKCWCQALDETLNMSDTLNSWQELDSSPDSISNGRSKDYCEKFVSRAGIWGCLLAAVITAKMSRYILTSDIRKTTECCLLSALLFKSLFYVSLPHPDEDRDYALYEIGEGCEAPELIPGIDLFSDRHRADAITVVSNLGFLISQLHSVAQNLMVLPLVTLYQYFAGMICHDTVRCVEARILKIKVLTDLYLLAEAFHELFLLNIGIRIPIKGHRGFTPADIPLINHANVKFSSCKTLLCSENLQAVEEILNRKPNACLLSLSDKTSIAKLELAKTHFILKLSSTINAIPEVAKKPSNCATGNSTEHQSKAQETGSLADSIEPKDKADTPVQLASKPDLSLPELKNILLSEAEGRVTSILQDIERKYSCQLSECSAVDLEMAVEAKLQLCTIAQQRQYTASSVAMAVSALRLLQEAKIFAVKVEPDRRNVSPSCDPHSARNGQISDHTSKTAVPVESEARERLNMHTWLRCRLALVTSLIRQMPTIALHDRDMLDGSALITEGIVEAETLNDFETQAHFLLQAVFLDIQDGHSRKGVQLMLENIIHLLQGKRFISPMAYLTLAQSLILSADLMENNEDQLLFWTKQLNIFTLVHKIIIRQLTYLGEMKEQNVTQPVLSSFLPPIKNMYLPQISLLAKVKMRIGHVLTLQVNSTAETSRNPSQLLPSLNLYNTALELCRISTFREYDLEAELLFLKGKAERLMFILGDHDKSWAVKSFSEAINVSSNNDQNFSLIRKSYLEIALVYLHMCRLDTNKINNISIQILETPETTTSKSQMDKVMQNQSEVKTMSPSEFYRLLAWIAIRAATQVGEAMLAYKQLLGESSVTVQSVRPTLQEHIPSFAFEDLLATYKKYMPVDGQKCADKVEGTVRSPVDGKQDQGDFLPIEMLSCVHVIRYHNHLMRLKNMLTLTDFSERDDGKVSAGDTLYTSVLDNGITVRYVAMHLFLKKYLYSYSICCVNDFPPELLLGLQQESKGLNIEPKTNSESEETSQESPWSIRTSASLFPDCRLEALNEQMATHALDKELCLQWYFPTSEKRKNMVLLMYAYNKQNVTVKDPRKLEPAGVLCGCSWISLPHVLSLHEMLCVLRQEAELSLQPVIDASVPEIGEKQKRSAQTARNKSDLNPVRLTEDLQIMILQCCSEVQALLSSAPNPQQVTQAPFDITLPSLIRLERIFDLTHGCMLMKGSLLDWTASQFT